MRCIPMTPYRSIPKIRVKMVSAIRLLILASAIRSLVRSKDNFIDKDLESMFFPLHLMQSVLLNPKYIIKKGLIKPTNILYKLLSVVLTVLLGFVYLYRVQDLGCNIIILQYLSTMYYSAYFDLVFYSIGFTAISILNVFNSKHNIEFFLKIQDLHRALNNDTSSKRFIKWNWIYVIGNVFVSFFTSIVICFLLHIPIYMYVCCVSLILFDATMVYATRMIAFLADKTNLWADKVKRIILHRSACVHNEDSCEAMFQAFKHILESYEMYKSSFQLMILFNIIHFFCHILIYVEITVEGLTSWLFKILMTHVFLSCYFETFYTAMYKTQDVCAIILNSDCTDAERRLCKNIQRLYEVEFDKMNVCRIVRINASLPLDLIELTTNYTIALLQFALLQQLEEMKQVTDVHVEQLTGAHLAERRAV
ncbi:hypothetical protein SFRURICE_017091 [Spodoptera frugiperda]|nr:hypothetical protein SFRURICE_017091 [Spodoptera frugiperda]